MPCVMETQAELGAMISSDKTRYLPLEVKSESFLYLHGKGVLMQNLDVKET